ncbi:DUF4198 domain-containing protein [Spirosoma sp. HMF4905]|uniref:DUF4198 domain-containing protein n=1 Tax=Spirosoma arboris TaxID=2682092 RepID=A0A7K1SJM4_9BACT|nr:DUF4198 domain-containing protein [Spirosoma arboris]MVM33944.1 DUF4198 domain-containing protein [Spirosoma arboris]
MNRFSLLILLISLLNFTDVYAHALWIQTNSIGKKSQKQTVTILYAEPGETPEKVADWYSDVSQFDLWLISPDGQKTKLPVTSVQDHFIAEFTPEQDGVYTLAVGHVAKELGGTTKYQFNATATVSVGKVSTASQATPNELNVALTQADKTPKVGQTISLAGYFKEKPSEKLHVTVSSPSGWIREIQTKANGIAEFTPLWPGRYWIEASKTEKQTGEQNGKTYQSVWRCATYVVDVK